jgi:hypothetical protein
VMARGSCTSIGMGGPKASKGRLIGSARLTLVAGRWKGLWGCGLLVRTNEDEGGDVVGRRRQVEAVQNARLR